MQMQRRNLLTVVGNLQETPDTMAEYSSNYDPFLSPHYLKSTSSLRDVEVQFASNRTLFQFPDEAGLFGSLRPYEDEETAVDLEREQLVDPYFKMMRLRTQISISKGIEDNKQNSSSNNSSTTLGPELSLIRRKILRYPETPQFQKLVKDSFRHFMDKYHSKIDQLERNRDTTTKIPITTIIDSPIKNMATPYKFYLGLADALKRAQGMTDVKIMAKIAIYLQPTDEICWAYIAKLATEACNFPQAVHYLSTGYMATKSDTILDQYIKYAQKAQVPTCELQSTAVHLLQRYGNRAEKYFKPLWQLASILSKRSQGQTSVRLLLYLLRSETCSVCIHDVVKTLEAQKDYYLAVEIVGQLIETSFIRHSSIYQTYIKLLEQIGDLNLIRTGLKTVQRRIESQCPKDFKWKIHFELSQSYLSIQDYQKYKAHSIKALDLSVSSSKLRVYLSIAAVVGYKLVPTRNQLLIVQINRRNFVEYSDVSPLIFGFSDWKYYLHYSLYYLINGSQEAFSAFRSFAETKTNSGRLHSQMIWIDRVNLRHNQALRRWEQSVMEMPKSGEIWCEGGRIYIDKGDIGRAEECFRIAIELTPQFGDSFVQLLNIHLLKGEYNSIKRLKKKLLFEEPSYGSLWSYLKRNTKSSVVDVWRRAKHILKCQLYSWNESVMEVFTSGTHLTAVNQFNLLFFKQSARLTRAERERLFFSYDQTESRT